MVADGVGTFATDIFATSKAVIPMLPSGFATIHLLETPGTAPDLTHNDLITPAYIQPSVQVTARSADAETAYAKLQLAYNSLVKIRNQFINSGWYVWVKPTSHFLDAGLDARGQARISFNVTVRKRP